MASEDLKKLGVTSIKDNANPEIAEEARGHANNSSNDSGNDSENNDDRNHDYIAETPLPSPKRKRSRTPSSRTSNAASKQQAQPSTKRRKLIPVPREPPINDNFISDTNGNSKRRESDRKISRQQMSTTILNRPHEYNNRFSRRQKQTRSRRSADDSEYEVEEILDARLNRGNLEYHVKWVGYKDDCNWYHASGFENSPYLVRNFHANNPTHPGPPQSLDSWIQRWGEDGDTE